MNLQDAISQTALRTPVRNLKPQMRNKYQVAKRVFQLAAQGGFPYTKMTYQQWANMWLKSDKFKLMEIDIAAAASLNINAAASPHPPKNPNRVEHYLHCSVESLDPIVVDLNKRGVGRTYLGYVPKVVVLDGKHRKKAQLEQGRTRILAWVGCKAMKQMPVQTLHEVNEIHDDTIGLQAATPHNGNGTKIDTAFNLYAATVPSVGIPAIRQDSGEGGSRPKDHLHSSKKSMKGLGGTGAGGMGGPGASNQGGSGNINKPMNTSLAAKDCEACGARSSGMLVDDSSNDDHKVPPDQSDSKQAVDPSDRLKWDGKKANNQTPGTKPGYSDRFGSPNIQSPGSGTGPRVKNTGGSKSDFSRQLTAGKRIGKIWNKDKKDK